MTEQELRVIISQNIKRIRGYRKFSQAEFAEKIDISVPFLSDIENGKKWGSPVTLVKIAEALNIEVYELFIPETVIPDNAADVIEKYTADIHQIFGDTLNNIQNRYLQRIKKNRK